jgi:hypothetical protein
LMPEAAMAAAEFLASMVLLLRVQRRRLCLKAVTAP